jgi:ADP-ribosyl-[dinitrogen reductase] hydrolase
VKRRQFVAASTRITHTDPRAEVAALAVAEAAAWALDPQRSVKSYLCMLSALSPDPEWVAICQKLSTSLASRQSVADFASSLGLSRGVTGYAYHSVPVALYSFLRQPDDFRTALESALDCGGDTDTVGAITGSLCGLMVHEREIPHEWLSRIRDWPRSRSLLRRVGERLAEQNATGESSAPVSYFWPGLILRNVVFVLAVLAHVLRRLLPPY